MSNDQFPMNAQGPMLKAEAAAARAMECGNKRTATHSDSLSLHRMRGEGWGEGLRASALVASPLIRPAATFSPRSAKGEGEIGSPRQVLPVFIRGWYKPLPKPPDAEAA